MLTNLQIIDAEQASQLTQFFCRTGGVIFLFGQSGVGKTNIVIDSILASGYKACQTDMPRDIDKVWMRKFRRLKAGKQNRV